MDSKFENALIARIHQLEERLNDSFGEIHSLQVQNSLLKNEIQQYKWDEMPTVVSSDEDMPELVSEWGVYINFLKHNFMFNGVWYGLKFWE